MKKVFIITLCWVLIQAFFYVQNYLFVTDLVHLEKLSGSYEFWPDFIGNFLLSIVGGLFGGYYLVYRMPFMFTKRSFTYGIVNSGLYFVVLFVGLAIICLFLLGFTYFIFQTDFAAAFAKATDNVLLNLNTPSFFTTMIMWGLLVSATQFMLQVNDKFGQGVLVKFLTGKYYKPREEERVFMFLDLKSSTSIAENIENRDFFELLREIYYDITEPIISNLGEIYQYVGDEVVVTWSLEKGLQNNNCINCFFNIKKKLGGKNAHYKERYGIVPSFKAGLHVGKAIVGELGVIKKDIVYSGDVLNTTSRIQGLCNYHGVEILISSALIQRLSFEGEFVNVPLGEIHLRGKKNTISLNTLKIPDLTTKST